MTLSHRAGLIECAACCREDDNCCDGCEAIDKAAEKLKVYEDAEKQGLLLRLPAPLDGVESFSLDGKTKWVKYVSEEFCGSDRRTPMTNGDRIRRMTDEKLALHIDCPYGWDLYTCDHTNLSCEECKLQWLQEVAE